MNWVYLLVLAVGLAFANAPAHADTERRVALIIGNDAYKGLKPLDNAVNDARAMAAELKGLGWATTVKVNAGRREMNGAMADFSEQLAGGAVGLFYYAGHGIEAGGQNFLVPVDAVLEREADLSSEAVDAGRLVQAMKTAKNRLNIVILDACRDNPLKGRSGSRGLAVLPASGAGLFLAYAAGPGEKAEDGAKGANGVFTAELVKALREPGLRIEDVFKKATTGVRARTAGKQVPWVQASIEGDFYFRPGSAARNEAGGAGGGNDGLFWSSIKDSRDASDFQAYLDRYPSGDFAALARTRLDKLKGTTQTAALVPPRPEPVLDALDRELVAGRKASLRDAPEAKAKLIASLSEGDTVQVTGKVKGENWYAVNRKGQTAYVVTDTLEEPATYKERKAREVRAAAEEEGLRQQAAAAEEEERQRQQLAALAAAGQERQRQQAAARSPGSVFRDCADCPEMVVVPAGSFMMGSDDGSSDEKPVHPVTIARAFAVGKYEVTQAEWQAVMGTNPSKFSGARNPVEQVSWDDAQDFIRRLNEKVRSVVSVSTGGDGPYRLLTEAEWEYAARAGTTTTYSCGDSAGCLSSSAVYSHNSSSRTAQVGSKVANAFGLHDMHGNVWEWVQDCYADSYANAPSDGGLSMGSNACSRVLRGGSWGYDPRYLRSAGRSRRSADGRGSGLGFRLARTLR